MSDRIKRITKQISPLKLTAIAFAVIIFTLASSKNVFAFGRKYFSLIAGQGTKIRCYAGQLGVIELSDSEWEIRCLGSDEVIFPTPTPSPSITPTPTGTLSPTTVPTSTLSPTPTTAHSDGTTTTASMQFWHSPGAHDSLNVHEHGDAPPTWANDFSQKNFGHPVILGGDEATPNENTMKHQAYKGFTMTASGVELYIRHHSQSNPHGRSAPFHSYEVYAKDGSGNVSFWQGHMFYGYPERRDQRMARHNEEGGYDTLNGITWPGRSQFIIAGSDHYDWNDYKRCEQWYGHGGLWSWDVSITICGASTYYHVDEHLGNLMDMSTWDKTGSVGATRRLEVSHYGPQNPNVGGENLPFNQWFCAKKLPNENRATGQTPTWDITGAVSGPNACQSGYLSQYVANTFPKAGVYFQTGNTAEKTFPIQGVTLPN